MREERMKNENFPYLFAHSSLVIVYILLKNFKVFWETAPIKKTESQRNPSINFYYKFN